MDECGKGTYFSDEAGDASKVWGGRRRARIVTVFLMALAWSGVLAWLGAL